MEAGEAAAVPAAVPLIRYEAYPKPTLPHEKEEPWWAFLVRYKNIQMTILALLFWVVCIIGHTYLTRISWHRGVVKFNMVGTPPLHDLLHEVMPNTQRLRVIPEIGHVLPVLYLSGLMLYHFDQRSLDCFRTFLVSHGVLLMLRGISFVGTLLPDSSQQCHVSLFVGSCHDLIFSGHVTIMLICVLLVQHFFEIPPVLRVFVGIDAAVVCFFVISSRNHYTVDVVLAVVITLLVYLAFTRHPYLVSLCVETPVNVLSMPCLMDPTQRGGMCGCVSPEVQPMTTREGYRLLSDSDALKRMTEHAFASLRLLGLRPSVTMRLVDASGTPLPIGAAGGEGGAEQRQGTVSPPLKSVASAGSSPDFAPLSGGSGARGRSHERASTFPLAALPTAAVAAAPGVAGKGTGAYGAHGSAAAGSSAVRGVPRPHTTGNYAAATAAQRVAIAEAARQGWAAPAPAAGTAGGSGGLLGAYSPLLSGGASSDAALPPRRGFSGFASPDAFAAAAGAGAGRSRASASGLHFAPADGGFGALLRSPASATPTPSDAVHGGGTGGSYSVASSGGRSAEVGRAAFPAGSPPRGRVHSDGAAQASLRHLQQQQQLLLRGTVASAGRRQPMGSLQEREEREGLGGEGGETDSSPARLRRHSSGGSSSPSLDDSAATPTPSPPLSPALHPPHAAAATPPALTLALGAAAAASARPPSAASSRSSQAGARPPHASPSAAAAVVPARPGDRRGTPLAGLGSATEATAHRGSGGRPPLPHAGSAFLAAAGSPQRGSLRAPGPAAEAGEGEGAATPAAAAQAAALRRRGRAHSNLEACEYEQLLASRAAAAGLLSPHAASLLLPPGVSLGGTPGARSRGSAGSLLSLPQQPQGLGDAGAAAGALEGHRSPAGPLLGGAAGEGEGEGEEGAEASEVPEGLLPDAFSSEDQYEIEQALARLIIARHQRHTPNRQHLAHEIAQAYARVQSSARRLLRPVSHLTGWVRGVIGEREDGGAEAEAAPEEGEEDDAAAAESPTGASTAVAGRLGQAARLQQRHV